MARAAMTPAPANTNAMPRDARTVAKGNLTVPPLLLASYLPALLPFGRSLFLGFARERQGKYHGGVVSGLLFLIVPSGPGLLSCSDGTIVCAADYFFYLQKAYSTSKYR